MKAPDISIQLSTSGLPRVTFECGFPESHDILQDDMIDWLMGGGGAVQAVVLVKWKPCQTTMTVRGDVELYTRDTNEVFPVPEGLGERQVLRLNRQMLFGGDVAPGRGEGDVFGLDIQVLRTVQRF
ncbi:uncharacterized protein ASPGLDRAFT_34425 [Aspergillus glaucus CBS 516.65]|uniref:Uncharacterized protein n=1 Tax=Aspergillus glaucus CBS 516.65 TaxID=1160497 RepID=A0A1L9VP39_ASPGL|nr:hypothetical protein ASPGLDRAFT_34425 [Aspergillus glaucus CBS 516.65]OJJ85651.1 hypothetical protein ASPGLDRAFT_34425 [Aspergillus glaucus CBS 516.65]